ncbi:MAG: alkaline phosphatase family protein, partial [Limisphaerales bacterium]
MKLTIYRKGCLLKASMIAAFLFASWPLNVRPATGTIQDVQHVVILMQENRSFDHYFGSLAGVCGFDDRNVLFFQNGSNDFYQPKGGNYVLPFHTPVQTINDIGHDENSGDNDSNSGWWNGWVPAEGATTMAYYTRTNLAFYYTLADAYTICDENFCSFMGPTYPNRLYLFTGMIDPNHTGGGPATDNSVPTNGYTWTTYPELLQSTGISWKVYRPVGDTFDVLQWFAQYMNATNGNPLYDRGMATVSNVVTAFRYDVTNGTLPSVSWVMPTYGSSEHPPGPPDN